MFIMIEKGIALETIYSNNGHSKFHEVWYETDDYAQIKEEKGSPTHHVMPYLPKVTNLTDSFIEAQSDKRPSLRKGE